MSGAGEPTELGTSFVPNSPEATAQQIAGQAANQAAQAALGQGQPMGAGQGQPMPGQGQGQPMPGMGEGQGSPMPGQDSPMGNTSASGTENAGSPKGGNTQNNQTPPERPLDLKTPMASDSRGDKVNQDSNAETQKFTKEPWFTKLPPGVRKAIEAKARREAPRGYEERLRRYFESSDEKRNDLPK